MAQWPLFGQFFKGLFTIAFLLFHLKYTSKKGRNRHSSLINSLKMLNLRIGLIGLIIVFILYGNSARKLISHWETWVQRPYKNMPKARSIATLERNELKFKVSSRNKSCH